MIVNSILSRPYPSPANYEVSFDSVEEVNFFHNSGKMCHVIAIDNSNNEEFECLTTHLSENRCLVEWEGSRSGKLVIR